MMLAHVLIRAGYGFDVVMDMDEEDVAHWVGVSTRFNKLVSATNNSGNGG